MGGWARFADARPVDTLELGSGDQIPYTVHLPDGFDPSKTHPVLAGPGEAEKSEDAG